MTDPVTRWFDAQAASYDDASARWPWSAVRAGEAAAVDAALGDVGGVRVLELGCGAGFYTRRLLDAGAAHVTAVDRSARMVDRLPWQVRGVTGDAAELDLHERFDVVLCAGMLEFVDDPGRVLRAARRHVDVGGRLVLLAPGTGLLPWLYRRWHAGHGVATRAYAAGVLGRLGVDAGWRQVSEVRVWPYNVCAVLVAV